MAYNRKSRNDGPGFIKLGNIINSKNGLTIILDDNVQLTVNGHEVLGKFVRMEKPIAKYERMVEKGSITEEEFLEKEEQLSNGKTKYELTFEPSAFQPPKQK